MVVLLEEDIQTKEVLDWKGLHLFHFSGSTCSQKTRIFLRLKGIEWTGHHLNLARKEHHTAWYMGINPRGLVPTLIHDGKVIIESNDILEYLEAQFPERRLMPDDKSDEIRALLKAEDDLHMDIRALTMRFMFPSFLTKRPESELKKYEELGSGTVEGEVDSHKQAELKFWRDIVEHGKVTDEQAARAFNNFRAQFNSFDKTLANQLYLTGSEITLADIAWYIYAQRLINSSYPLHKLHPAVGQWFDRLHSDPNFRNEVPSGGPIGAITSLLHAAQALRGTTLQRVVAKTA
ncbi:glutathione S-transferase family protein [Pyruvatibacter sp.]